MKRDIVDKKKLMLSIAVCILLVAIAFSGAVAKNPPKPKDKPDMDWDYSGNPPHMFSNVTGNVGIGTTNPEHRLDVNKGDAIIRGLDGFNDVNEEASLYLGGVDIKPSCFYLGSYRVCF